MSKYSPLLKKALKNKVLQYVFSRYATYLIQFVNSLFIAVYLGPYYLGIWGFITLIIQYLNQINLGIAHSANAIIAINKRKEWYVGKVIGTSLTMLLTLSFFVILFFTANEVFHLNIGGKYNFSTYAPIVALIGIIGYFNSLLGSVFRVYGKVIEIAINQSAVPVLMLIAILLFKGENLIWALVGANLLAFFLSLCLYLIKSPVKLKPLFIGRLVKTIQIKGWRLFIYNTSFYFIIISTRSFISAYYTIEEFGYFTFAFSLANVVLLLLQSFSFLIFPKILNRLAYYTSQKIIAILEMIRDTYLTTSHLVVHIAILFFPLFLLFFPQYKHSEQAFILISLTVVLYSHSFGYSALLISKGKENTLGYIAAISLIINIICLIILIEFINVSFAYVIIATMISYLFFVYLLALECKKVLKIKSKAFVTQELFPLSMMVPYFIALFQAFLIVPFIFNIIPIMLFILLNYKKLITLKIVGLKILNNPNVVDV